MDRSEIGRVLIRPHYLRPDGKVGRGAFAVIRESIREMNKVTIEHVVLGIILANHRFESAKMAVRKPDTPSSDSPLTGADPSRPGRQVQSVIQLLSRLTIN